MPNHELSAEAMALLKWDGKHPLQHTWSLWYSDRSLSREWKDCLKDIGSFSTIEDFWCVFNFLKPVSLLKSGCDIYLFKKGIRPMWEDPANKLGGRWDIVGDKGFQKLQIDSQWIELAMAMVGEAFAAIGSLISGACVNKRDKNTRISIWTNVSNDQEKLIYLGKRIKAILGLPRDQIIYFRTHEDAARTGFRQNTSLSI